MSKLDAPEVAEIQRKLYAKKGDYESLSNYMLNKLLVLKESNPKIIRVVFSRQPRVKELNSLVKKIELCRDAGLTTRFEQITDLIALTVLCPFESDVEEVYECVKMAFEISPKFEEAARDSANGHRGHHFTLKLFLQEAIAYPSYRGLICELQIKTLLEEAFDAKSHDLAYKPGKLEVGGELQKQFKFLSKHLQAIDGQSEFLKDLILREKKELDLRRRACLQVYVKDFGTVPAELGIDLEHLPNLATIAAMVERSELTITRHLCKFVAYCATKLESEYLKKLAFELIERYVDEHPGDPRRYFGRGAIYWALGRHEQAVEDMQRVIDEAEGKGDEESVTTRRQAKNNFVYFMCDWEIFSTGVPEDVKARAEVYLQTLSTDTRIQELDTLGLHKVIYSQSVVEIDQGRLLLAESLAKRKDSRELYDEFHSLHQFIAINRMMKLITKPTR